jgi:hypothetical protein
MAPTKSSKKIDKHSNKHKAKKQGIYATLLFNYCLIQISTTVEEASTTSDQSSSDDQPSSHDSEVEEIPPPAKKRPRNNSGSSPESSPNVQRPRKRLHRDVQANVDAVDGSDEAQLGELNKPMSDFSQNLIMIFSACEEKLEITDIWLLFECRRD